MWVRPAAQGNGNWNSVANWVGGASYMPDDPDERAIFNHPSTNGMPIQNANMVNGLGQLRFNHAGWVVYVQDPLRFNSISHYQSLAIEARALSGAGTITLYPAVNLLNGRQVIATGAGALLALAGGVTGSNAPVISSFDPTAPDTGAVRLNAASDVTDAFGVRQGTLLVAHSGGLGASPAPVVLGDTGTAAQARMLLLTDANNVTISKSITVQNYGAIAVLGANHATGSSTFSGAVTVNRPTLLWSAGGVVTFAGQMSGAGALTVTGMGTVVLSGTNVFSGPLFVGSGTLRLGANGALPSGATVSLSPLAGTLLDLNGYTATVSSLTGGGTSAGIALGSGALTVQSGSFAGPISGAGSVTKTGSGALTLSGSNSYAGGTTISGGTLNVDSSSALPANGSVSIANVPGVTLNLNGHSAMIGWLTGGGALGGHITLGAGTLTVQGGSFSGAISGAGAVVKSGGGTLVLGGNNVYEGGTTIQGGTLQLASSAALPAGGAVTLANSAGTTLDLNGQSLTIGSLTGGGQAGGNIVLRAGTLTVQSGSYTGAISGAGGLVKSGPGTLTLAGNNAYAGGTIVQEGTLRLGSAAALPAGGAVTLGDPPDARLDLNGHSVTVGSLNGAGGAVLLGNGTLTIATDGLDSFGGAITGGGAVVKSGSGQLALRGNNLYTGGTTIQGGTLVVDQMSLPQWGAVALANATGARLLIENAAYVGQLTGGGPLGGVVQIGAGSSGMLVVRGGMFGGRFTGSGVVSKVGEGTLILTSDQDNPGTLTIQEGTVQLGMGGTAGSYAGGIINEGTLAVVRSDDVTMTNWINGGGGLRKGGVGRLTLTGELNYFGDTVVEQGTLRINTESGPFGRVRVEPLGGLSATLSGEGRIRGDVDVQAAGVLAPGRSVGTLTVDGNVTLAGTLEIELRHADADLLNVGQTLDLTGATFSFAPTYPLTAPVYVLATYGHLVGQFSQIKKMPPGMWLDYNYGGANQIALVPEPGLVTLLAAGGALMLAVRRLRRGGAAAEGQEAPHT
ncbi:MAG: autotransporter-associated beta strand repeat-containing protein [Kiritimatiellae bacterium]|nr:autotransporter-associated beta strand repeat-containing protein [Kiritimatiellia bacterium]